MTTSVKNMTEAEYAPLKEHLRTAIVAAQDAGAKDAKEAHDAFMGTAMEHTCFKVGFIHALTESAKTQQWLTVREYVDVATAVWTECVTDRDDNVEV